MPRRQLDLRLRDGSHIVIVGAGPAGTFFAHFARSLAAAQGLDVTITICDGKDFARQGPLGCNMCAGVISGPLAAQLDELGFSLPDDRVQQRIEGYYVQAAGSGFPLDHPAGRPGIRSVFRGNGPRFSSQDGNISFDDFLLDHVKAEGVTLVPFPVHEIRLPSDPRARVTITYGDKRVQGVLEADLVVGAFGLNSVLMQKVQALGFGYRPPSSRRACQAELPVGREWIERRLHNRIAVLALRAGPVDLAVFTPKTEHLTLTLLGRGDIRVPDLHAFLAQPAARDLLPPDWAVPPSYCHCFPQLPVTAAKRPFADRLVIIGDASFSRYYKNGIESALITAKLAAETAFQRGLAAECFAAGYAKPAHRLIVRDNFYGRLLFRLPSIAFRNPALAEAQRRIIAAPVPDATALALSRNLWNVLTGDVPYRKITWQILSPRLLARLATVAMAIYLRRLVGRRTQRSRHRSGDGV